MVFVVDDDASVRESLQESPSFRRAAGRDSRLEALGFFAAQGDAMIDHLEYSLETIRNDGEFILYRGRRQTDETPSSVLALTPASEPPPLACLRRMENEYFLRTDLDSG